VLQEKKSLKERATDLFSAKTLEMSCIVCSKEWKRNEKLKIIYKYYVII